MDLDGLWFACGCGSERHLLEECAAQRSAEQSTMATGAGLATTTILLTPDETEPESEAAWWRQVGGRRRAGSQRPDGGGIACWNAITATGLS